MDAPIHIAHVVSSFGCGGLERVIANLITHSNPTTHRHSVISLTDDLSFRYALPPDTTIISLDKKPGHDLGVHLRLLKALNQIKPQVLHTYNFATLEYHPIAKLAGVTRHIHADHGLGGDHPEGKNKKHNWFRKVISWMINDYIVVSENLKQWVTDEVGVNGDKVHFVFNGVTVPDYVPLPKKPAGRLNMVIIGRLHKVKNHTRLLHALHEAKTRLPDANLYLSIVGDGPERENIAACIDDLGLNDNVSLLGHQNDVAPFIQKSDVFVLSSDYEAMPMTVLEAMALSRPVICPAVGGVADFINADDIFLTPGKNTTALSNAIVKLATTPSQQYEDKVATAHQKVKSMYSIQHMVNHYNQFYDSGCR